MSSLRKAFILGTKIDNYSKPDVLLCIQGFLNSAGFYQIATVNPEFLLEARKNKPFQDVLNHCDLNIPDGIGIKWAFWRYGMHLKARYSGADLMWDILEIADKKGFGVYLVANKEGLSTWQETRDAIKKIYPNLKIGGKNIKIQKKSNLGSTLSWTLEEEIPVIGYELLITNLGAPEQEFFINKVRKNAQNSDFKLGIGVGGTFDYMTGKVPRAPKFMRLVGLEWLFRLIKQPKRLKRVLNAVFVFPLVVIFTKK